MLNQYYKLQKFHFIMINFKNPRRMWLILLMYALSGINHGITNGELSTEVIKMYQDVQFVK